MHGMQTPVHKFVPVKLQALAKLTRFIHKWLGLIWHSFGTKMTVMNYYECHSPDHPLLHADHEHQERQEVPCKR